jgi:hypothetical protein
MKQKICASLVAQVLFDIFGVALFAVSAILWLGALGN